MACHVEGCLERRGQFQLRKKIDLLPSCGQGRLLAKKNLVSCSNNIFRFTRRYGRGPAVGPCGKPRHVGVQCDRLDMCTHSLNTETTTVRIPPVVFLPTSLHLSLFPSSVDTDTNLRGDRLSTSFDGVVRATMYQVH